MEGLKNIVSKAPISRHGTAAEVSAAVAFLMSPMAAYITGIDLRVDGGMHHGRGSFLFRSDSKLVNPPFNGFHRDEVPALLKK